MVRSIPLRLLVHHKTDISHDQLHRGRRADMKLSQLMYRLGTENGWNSLPPTINFSSLATFKVRLAVWISPRFCDKVSSSVFFTARRNARIASAVLATAILSVCPSVCPSVRLSYAGIVSKQRHVARCSLHCQIAKPKTIPQGRPLPPEILVQADLPPPDSSES